jgi:replicative DNA helicase
MNMHFNPDFKEKHGGFTKKKPKDEGNKRPLPTADDAERVVCATFMAHNHLFEVHADKIKPEDFNVPMHRQIMEVGLRLVVEHKPANSATIASKITELSPIPDLSVGQYLRELNRFIKAKDEAEAYVNEVRLASTRRKVIELTERFNNMAYTADDGIVNQLSSEVALLAGGGSQIGFQSMSPVFDDVFQDIMQADAAGFRPTGYRSNFPEIDAAIGGFKKSKLYYVVANEKVGKSALMLSVARQFLLQDIAVAIFSLEMKAKEIGQRLITMESGINTVNRPEGMRLTEEESVNLASAADRCASWPIYCNDLANLTPSAIIMNARHAVKVHGAKVIIVDYVQIVAAEDNKTDNRTRVERASRAMAMMAKELDIPVIALAQLNRQALGRGSSLKWDAFVESQTAARPRRGDIRETAQIEMDADAVIAIFRPEVLMEELRPVETMDAEEMINFDMAMSKFKGRAELSVILNRAGPNTRCNCRFNSSLGLFEPINRKN